MRFRFLAFSAIFSLGAAAAEPAREFFENEIRPALAKHCAACHSGDRPQGGLRLDHRAGWEAGGKSGAAIVKGDPSKSLLLRVMRREPGVSAMPMGSGPLDPKTIAAFERWIRDGAFDPRDKPAAAAVAKSWDETFRERSQWWSLMPVHRPAVPTPRDAAWPKGPLDRFILAKLEQRTLRPAPRADRPSLLRRASFVLTGLPPSPGEIDTFVRDAAPDAYEKAVERLMSSIHFGEHWARHWMDVVRYSDTYGYEWDIPAKGAWRYRDYLIRALNGDVPYDQLVREQIAGDLLPTRRVDPREKIDESILGTMFYQLGEKRHGDSLQFNGIHQEMLNNKIDAFSKAFLGMTVACARCHDHRLDAISQRDYYSLGGAFMSSRWVTNTADAPERNRETLAELAAMKPAIRAAAARQWESAAADIPRYMLAADACLRGSRDAERLSAGLDETLLAAWKKALRVDHGTTPPLENPMRPWFEAARAKSAAAEAWRAIAAEYARESAARGSANAAGFTTLADFRSSTPDGWSVDGAGLRHGRTSAGDFAVDTTGKQSIAMLFPAGLFTNTLSPRLNGAVRSPFTGSNGRAYVSFELAGGDFAAYRLVIDNAFLTERQTYLNGIQPVWAKLAARGQAKDNRAQTDLEKAETRVYVEAATKTSNPNFPPRVGLGGKCTEEQAREPQSWFGITRVVAHDGEKPPADELERFASLFGGSPSDAAGAAAEYGRWFSAAIGAWRAGTISGDRVRVVNWLIENRLLPNDPAAGPELAALIARYRETERRVAEPWTVNGMADIGAGFDYRLNKRGTYEDLGDAVPRGFLEVLSKSSGPVAGSGRLGLAQMVAAGTNPLTARVWVNRVWHWTFGTGIVQTVDDFGHLGDRPSHPELLDWLASDFMSNGWSTKNLIRQLVLSETFRQSSAASPATREGDPSNRLLARYPPRRLEAESIRDAMLAVSGRLDRRPYGETVNPPRSNEDAEKRLFSGPLDGDGRRSIYTKMTIMEPPKFLAAFNQPAPKIPMGRRDETNVPAQALALLNDPLATGQAEFWARRLIETPHATPEQRIDEMFRRAFARPPDPADLARWSRAARDFAGLYQDVPGAAAPDMMKWLAVWKDVAHAMFNAKEFLYVR